MARNFDELLPKERSFVVRGETFHFEDVSPDVLTAFEVSENGDETTVWQIMDQQIALFLTPEDRKRWTALRKRAKEPVTIAQMNALLVWLLEEQTGVPTPQPAPSAPGRGKTAVSSTAA